MQHHVGGAPVGQKKSQHAQHFVHSLCANMPSSNHNNLAQFVKLTFHDNTSLKKTVSFQNYKLVQFD